VETESFVRIDGNLHFIQGDDRGENKEGKYLRFALKRDYQDVDGSLRHDFIILRAYDNAIKDWILSKREGTPVLVEGELRSSRGSGEVYVYVKEIRER